MKKKFGEDFYEEYEHQGVLKAREELEAGAENITPLIPEIEEFTARVYKTNSVEELLELAKKEGMEFTEEELKQEKSDVVKFLTEENDHI